MTEQTKAATPETPYLDDLQVERMVALRTLRQMRRDLELAIAKRINRLNEECEKQGHVIVCLNTVARCMVCDKDFGWWCPVASNHLCVYDENNVCKLCNQPDERT